MSGAKRRLAVLVSGSGSNLQALIDAIEQHELPNVEIALVVSNKANAVGLQRALTHKLPAFYLPWSMTRQEVEAKLATVFALFQIDLIVLAGWMRIFTPDFIAHYPNRIINLHPALLPDNGQGHTFTTSNGSVVPVLRGLHVVKHALEAGVKVTGSTVHYVTPEVDAGPMICRAEVPIEDSDTEETLHERIKQVEHKLLVEAVKKLTLL
ncbi:MAG: phosphoribosylglycinamide formyltransferase [Ktedonobacteraceae bacterium]